MWPTEHAYYLFNSFANWQKKKKKKKAGKAYERYKSAGTMFRGGHNSRSPVGEKKRKNTQENFQEL